MYTALVENIPIVPIKIEQESQDAELTIDNARTFLRFLDTNVYDDSFMQEKFGVGAWAQGSWDRIENSCQTPNGESLRLRAVQDILAARLLEYMWAAYKPGTHPAILSAMIRVILDRIHKELRGNPLAKLTPRGRMRKFKEEFKAEIYTFICLALSFAIFVLTFYIILPAEGVEVDPIEKIGEVTEREAG